MADQPARVEKPVVKTRLGKRRQTEGPDDEPKSKRSKPSASSAVLSSQMEVEEESSNQPLPLGREDFDIPISTPETEREDVIEMSWEETFRIFSYRFFTEATLKEIILDPEAYTIAPQRVFLFALKSDDLLMEAENDTMRLRVYYNQTETGERIYRNFTESRHVDPLLSLRSSTIVQTILDYESRVLSFTAERNPIGNLTRETVLYQWLPFADFLANYALPWFKNWTERVAREYARTKIRDDVRVDLSSWYKNTQSALNQITKEIKEKMQSIETQKNFDIQQKYVSRQWKLEIDCCRDPENKNISVNVNQPRFLQRLETVKQLLTKWCKGDPADEARPILLPVYYLVETCAYLWDTMHLSLTLTLNSYLDKIMRPEKVSDPTAHVLKLHWLATHVVELPVSMYGRMPMYPKFLGHRVYDSQYRSTHVPVSGLKYLTLTTNRLKINGTFNKSTKTLVKEEMEDFLEAATGSRKKPERTMLTRNIHIAGSQLLKFFFRGLYNLPPAHVTSCISTLWQMRMSFVKGCMWSVTDHFIISDNKTAKNVKEDIELMKTFTERDFLFDDPIRTSRLNDNKQNTEQAPVVDIGSTASVGSPETATLRPTNGRTGFIRSQNTHKSPDFKTTAGFTSHDDIQKSVEETISRMGSPEHAKEVTKALGTFDSESRYPSLLAKSDEYTGWLRSTEQTDAFELLSLVDLLDRLSRLKGKLSPATTTEKKDMDDLKTSLNELYGQRKTAASGVDTASASTSHMAINDYTTPLYFALLSQEVLEYVVKLIDWYLKQRTENWGGGIGAIAPVHPANAAPGTSVKKALALLYAFRQLIDEKLRGTIEALIDDRATMGLMQILEAYQGDQFTSKIYSLIRQHSKTGERAGWGSRQNFNEAFVYVDNLFIASNRIMEFDEEEGENSAITPLRENLQRVFEHAKYFQVNIYMLLETAIIALHCIPAVARSSFAPNTLGGVAADEDTLITSLSSHLFPDLAGNYKTLNFTHIFRVQITKTVKIGFNERVNPLTKDETGAFYVQMMKRKNFSLNETSRQNLIFGKLGTETHTDKLADGLQDEFAGNIVYCMDILCTLLHPNFELVHQIVAEVKNKKTLESNVETARKAARERRPPAVLPDKLEDETKHEHITRRQVFQSILNAQFSATYKLGNSHMSTWDPTTNNVVPCRGMVDVASTNSIAARDLMTPTVFPRLSWINTAIGHFIDKYQARTFIISYLMYHISRGKLRFASVCVSNHKLKTYGSLFEWELVTSSAFKVLASNSLSHIITSYLGEHPAETLSAFLMNVMKRTKGDLFKEVPMSVYLADFCPATEQHRSSSANLFLGSNSSPNWEAFPEAKTWQDIKVRVFNQEKADAATSSFASALNMLFKKYYGFGLTHKHIRPASVTKMGGDFTQAMIAEKVLDPNKLYLDTMIGSFSKDYRASLEESLKDFFYIRAESQSSVSGMVKAGTVIAQGALNSAYQILDIASHVMIPMLYLVNKGKGKIYHWSEPADFTNGSLKETFATLSSWLTRTPKFGADGWVYLKTPTFNEITIRNKEAQLGIGASIATLLVSATVFNQQYGPMISDLFKSVAIDVWTVGVQFLVGTALPMTIGAVIFYKNITTVTISRDRNIWWTLLDIIRLVGPSVVLGVGGTFGFGGIVNWFKSAYRTLVGGDIDNGGGTGGGGSTQEQLEAAKEATVSTVEWLTSILGISMKKPTELFKGLEEKASTIKTAAMHAFIPPLVSLFLSAIEYKITSAMAKGWKGYRSWVSAYQLLWCTRAVRMASNATVYYQNLKFMIFVSESVWTFIDTMPYLRELVLAIGGVVTLIFAFKHLPGFVDTSEVLESVML